jgi:transposase
MDGVVALNKREQKRLMVLNKVNSKEIRVEEAATIISLSMRQTWRLLAAYRKEGAAALAHGNRGRKPPNAFTEDLKQEVRELATTRYRGFNHQHFTELLAEREGIFLSRSSVRNILLESGVRSPRKRRPPKHRHRRERYPQEGMLLQIDGSPHDWLEGRGPWLSLIGAVDDATGKVPSALFRGQEDAQGYFRLLQNIVQDKGIPLAIYHDQHRIFKLPADKSPSIEEQLEGKRPLTQFGRLLEELGITSIPALSPQAKGRIERLWGTFQDRLVSELRLAGAKTLDEANKVLQDFLACYNVKFAVPAAEPGSAYRQVGHGFIADEVFCFKHRRTVGADNVVRFEGHRLQVVPTNGRASYARCRVEVHVRLVRLCRDSDEIGDDSLAVYYQGKPLMTRTAPPEPRVQRAAKLPETLLTSTKSPATFNHKPAVDHPWRRWVYRANKQ